jgi:hypothetical protein
MKKITKQIDGTIVVSDDRTIEESKKENIFRISNDCSDVIYANGIDSITQQNAALGIYSPERCEAIKSYISACRNEYLRCKELILSAKTNDEADGVQFIAPSVPEGL